jgi:gas vesicle protein
MAKRTSIKKVAAFAALAGAIGYLAGVMTAPRSGGKTRKIWRQKGSQELDSAEENLKHLYAELSELITAAADEAKTLDGRNLKRFKEALTAAKNSKLKLGRVLEAVKEGASDDKDLDKAVREADKAIKHAKTFLLKK